MTSQWLKPRYILPVALAYLILHGLCIVITLPSSTVASYPFLILTPWLAFAACCWRVKVSHSRIRFAWTMLAIGMSLWACGMSLAAWEELSQHDPGTVAEISDFIYYIYGVPILLAISLPSESERVPLFLWLDGIQAVTTACLVYLLLFSAFPFLHQSIQPISASLLIQTYNIENLILACAATLRLLARSGEGEARRVYQILSGFLWIYAACAALYNYLFIRLQGQMGLYDLLVVLPFLLLAVLALFPPAQEPEISITRDAKPLALFIDNVSPVFYTVSLLTLCFVNVRNHFYLGIFSMVIALAVYAIRTTTLQSRYMRSQQALREARDELEKLSLQDGLTGVANRRCFDRGLELEWNRAIRMRHPLSLLLIDVDYFKSLNDKYGHRYGDQCLIEIAGALCAALPRSGDLLARYGGEEFAAILVSTGPDGAHVVASRMQASIRELNLQHLTATGPFVTVSIGIASYIFPQGGSSSTLVEASDRALYEAKRNGRNRIEYFSMQALLDITSPDEGDKTSAEST